MAAELFEKYGEFDSAEEINEDGDVNPAVYGDTQHRARDDTAGNQRSGSRAVGRRRHHSSERDRKREWNRTAGCIGLH